MAAAASESQKRIVRAGIRAWMSVYVPPWTMPLVELTSSHFAMRYPAAFISAMAAPMTDRCAFTRGDTRGDTFVVRMPPLRKWKPAVTMIAMIKTTRNQVMTKDTKGSVKM